MAFSVLFEQILIKLIAPYLESFTKYDAFFRTFSIYACLLQARSGSRKFGWGPGGMQFWIRLNVYYCKYKNGRRLDAEKGVNKHFLEI